MAGILTIRHMVHLAVYCWVYELRAFLERSCGANLSSPECGSYDYFQLMCRRTVDGTGSAPRIAAKHTYRDRRL